MILGAVGGLDDQGRVDADAFRERGRGCGAASVRSLSRWVLRTKSAGWRRFCGGLVVEPRVPGLLFRGELAGLGPVPEAVVAGGGEGLG